MMTIQRVPSGGRSDRQRRAFLKGHVLRKMNEVGGVEEEIFGSDTVYGSTQATDHVLGCDVFTLRAKVSGDGKKRSAS